MRGGDDVPQIYTALGAYRSQAFLVHGLTDSQVLSSFEHTVNDQAIMLSTNHVFTGCAGEFVLAACAIWLSLRPRSGVDTSAAH
jgi:DHA2 family multidrug resistance protein